MEGYELSRSCFFTSDAANQKLKFIGQLNKSFGSGGGFTCAFSDVELVRFIQYVKKRDEKSIKIKQGTTVIGKQENSNTWVLNKEVQISDAGIYMDVEESR